MRGERVRRSSGGNTGAVARGAVSRGVPGTNERTFHIGVGAGLCHGERAPGRSLQAGLERTARGNAGSVILLWFPSRVKEGSELPSS